MKLISVILFAACLQVSARGYAQITLSETNAPLQKVFQKIQQQSEYDFMSTYEILKEAGTVTVNVKNVSLQKALEECLKGKPLTYVIIGKTVVVQPKERNYKNSTDLSDFEALPPPPVEIRGKVVDRQGEPLQNVSVLIAGTTIGTKTGSDGQFTLTASNDKNIVLEFSSVGYSTKKVNVGTQTVIKVMLEENISGLGEIVVIGYGSVRKENVTSSISTLNSNGIKDRPLSTLGEAFAGQLAGVRSQNATGIPGTELQIRIRGINTINGNSSPLYVIDGVPREDMNDINPADVGSIQILKDASATAIYGARGANGVILIETKKGKGKPSLNIDALYGYQAIEKYMPMQNKDEWLAYHIWFRNARWLDQGGSMKDPMSARPASLQYPEEWLDPDLVETDWQREIFVNAPMQSYQLSTSGKSDMGSFYISGGYLDQAGIVYNTYYKRINFRANGELNISKRVKIGINIAPSFSDQDPRTSQGKEAVIHHALMQPPIIPLHSATQQWGYPAGMGSIYPNPVEQLKYTIDQTKRSQFRSGVWGQIELLKGLTFKTQYSLDFREDKYEFFQPGNVTYNNGFTTIGNSNVQSWNEWSIQNTLVYEKDYKDHSFNILLGQSADAHKYYRIEASASGWPNENIPTLNVATTPTRASTDKSTYTGSSFFGRVTYGYNDKYLLNASIRQDGSSRFGINNQWGVFPAVSAAWKINREAFLRNASWISLLKIRAAWGTAGNDRIGNYDYMAKMAVSNTSWGNAIVPGMVPSNIQNDNLKWETTQTADVGLDFSGFNNRLQISVDYYVNKTKDLLFNVPVPNTTGYANYTSNLGSVQNKGFELDITTRNTTGIVGWTTSVNLSSNKNKVLDMGGIQQFTSISWDGQFITRVGGQVAQYYVLRTNGLLSEKDFDVNGNALVPILNGERPGNVKYIDQNNDNIITTGDYVPYGSNIPDLIYGITNAVTWNNFGFSVLLQGQSGGNIMFLGQRQLDDGGGNINTFKRWVNSWKPGYDPDENPIPDIPGIDMSWDGVTPYKLGNADPNSDLRIYDASFIRIKNISLSYNFSKLLSKKGIAKGARIYFSADNVKTFDDYPGYTPESNSYGNETTQPGVDYSTYPLAKKYTIGISITF